MKYPKQSIFFNSKKLNDNEYEIENLLLDETYIFTKEYMILLNNLNGRTDPYSINTGMSDEEVFNALEFMDDNYIITYSRFLYLGFGYLILALGFPKMTPVKITIARIYFLILRLLWIPSLLYSCINLFSADMNTDENMLSWICPMALTVILHEIGHISASYSYKYKVDEYGISTMFFIPMAYVSIDDKVIKNRHHRIQIDSAGIRTNFLLCGLCTFIMLHTDFMNSFLSSTWIVSMTLGLINCTFFPSTDGCKIMSALLSDNFNFSEYSSNIRSSRSMRRDLVKKGPTGVAVIIASLIISGFKYIIPFFILLEVFSWIQMLES